MVPHCPYILADGGFHNARIVKIHIGLVWVYATIRMEGLDWNLQASKKIPAELLQLPVLQIVGLLEPTLVPV